MRPPATAAEDAMTLPNQRTVYLNGKFVPESEAVIPFRDRGFKYGDAVFDTTRTFGHRIFKLEEHLRRFYRSLRYVRIDPGLSLPEFTRVTEEVLSRNLPLLAKDEDYWVTQRVTRGIDAAEGQAWPEFRGPTVIVECLPLPLKQRARYYRDGIDVITPSVRRTAPDAISPRAKTHNYMNMVLADLEVAARDPEALAVLLDRDGNLAEGKGSNIFIAAGGRLLTPRERFVLPGISRATVMELAREAGIEVEEKDIDLFDAVNADEAFITSTSFCICPMRSINGALIAGGKAPGPLTKRLMDAYVRLVGFDWVGQYLKRLAA
jgi:branched-chain amino acid aminotransferase